MVDWDQPTPAGGEEPDLPVPTVLTTAAVAGTEGDGNAPAALAAASAAGDDGVARWLGAGGLALGVVALGLAGTSSLRTRRRVTG